MTRDESGTPTPTWNKLTRRSILLRLAACLLCTALIAADEGLKILVNNPGFESPDDDGRLPSRWRSIYGKALLMKGGGRTGERYLRLIDQRSKTSVVFESRRVAARPGGAYSASAWMRTDDPGRPGVYINFYNDQGARIHNVYARAEPGRSGKA